MVVLNPHAIRCGFMNPSQVQTMMPIHGRRRMNGRLPKTASVTAMSLMPTLSSVTAACGVLAPAARTT